MLFFSSSLQTLQSKAGINSTSSKLSHTCSELKIVSLHPYRSQAPLFAHVSGHYSQVGWRSQVSLSRTPLFHFLLHAADLEVAPKEAIKKLRRRAREEKEEEKREDAYDRLQKTPTRAKMGNTP